MTKNMFFLLIQMMELFISELVDYSHYCGSWPWLECEEVSERDGEKEGRERGREGGKGKEGERGQKCFSLRHAVSSVLQQIKHSLCLICLHVPPSKQQTNLQLTLALFCSSCLYDAQL